MHVAADAAGARADPAGRLPVRGAGVPALHPRDAVLNLPPGGFSWQARKLAEMTCRSGTCDSGVEIIRAVTGQYVHKRQLQEMMTDCAADAEAFAETGRCRGPGAGGPDGQETPATGVASADGKGVSMLPGALREDAARRAAKRDGPRARKLGPEEKSGNKRMAGTCVVCDCLPPGGEPRTAAEIMRRPRGEPARHPEAFSRAYACGIISGTAPMSSRRASSPRSTAATPAANGGGSAWSTATPTRSGHSPPKPRNAAWTCRSSSTSSTSWTTCGKPPGASLPAGNIAAAEAQVTDWGEAILLGKSRDVAADIGRRAAADPPKPGSEHVENIRKTLSYLQNKEPCLDYPTALAKGWPISTGVIEGACRHIVGDRMGITGARWSLAGAQAVLWMRAIHASGDTEAYWDHHIRAEHQRNHLGKYQDPAAILAIAA